MYASFEQDGQLHVQGLESPEDRRLAAILADSVSPAKYSFEYIAGEHDNVVGFRVPLAQNVVGGVVIQLFNR
jgi:hypothetical protein